MKQVFLTMPLILIIVLNAFAQNDTMYFLKNGEIINKQAINASDVDSIIFYNPNEVNNSTSVLIDNNSVWKDVNGLEIKAQGGCIIQEGQTFHWIGPDFEPGYSFIAINHYTSKDLKEWTKQAPLLTPGSPGMSSISVYPSTWVGRPWIIKHSSNDYVMWVELGKLNSSIYRNRYAIFAAPGIDGPWTFIRQYESLPDKTGSQRALGDLGAFHDVSTGNAYLVYTFDRDQTNGYQAIVQLSPDFRCADTVVAEFKKSINNCNEAAAIFKKDSTYYYIMSETRGWKPSNTWYRTATSMGAETAWSVMKQVKLDPNSGTLSFYTQHDFVLPVAGTSGNTYIYCGDRWTIYSSGDYDTQKGRQAWFPLTFDENGAITLTAPDFLTNGGDWSINPVTGLWSLP